MTEIKIEPIEEDDYDHLDIKKEVQEIVEVKDPLDIKLEPVVQDLPILDDDEDLDDLDDKTEKSEKSIEEDSDISDNENIDKRSLEDQIIIVDGIIELFSG